MVTQWPFIYYTGPLTPNVNREEIYTSPNGFKADLVMNGTDPNVWCVSGSGFGKLLEPYRG
jgi:hypothetical protein